jgi:hypothetical protein
VLAREMVAFLYRSPTTGLNVQGRSADKVGDDEDATYETVPCLACREVHLVSRSTRKV